MYERFTRRARNVMDFARSHANWVGSETIESEHLLLGWLQECLSTGDYVFSRDELEAMKADLHKQVKARPVEPFDSLLPSCPIPFSRTSKQAIEYAINEARDLGNPVVDSGHLVLGLMRDAGSMAGAFLKDRRVTATDIRANLKLAINDYPPAVDFNVSGILSVLLAGRDLPDVNAQELMDAIVHGRVSEAGIASVAVALRAKGESINEIAAFASVMRARAIQVRGPQGLLDTCGTGGDQSHTFNISTATAFVAAGMGIPVAKHGGRSSSSKTGSADVLKILGVNIDIDAAAVERCIHEAGIGFMFAPVFHPGMKHVAAVRKELGIRTIFNILGPLSNPAQAEFQLLGVYEPALCEKFAQVLKLLGSRSAMIVCGAGPDGKGHLDEISTFGPTTIAWLHQGKITVEEFHPNAVGGNLAQADALNADDSAQSAKIIQAVLAGEKIPARDIVVLNAAAAARVAGKASSWEEGIALAADSIDTGRAKQALENLVKCSNAKS